MDTDRVTGSTKDFAGRVEGTVGNIAGDTRAQADGLARQATGTAQDLYGQAKDMARDATDAATNYAKKAYENSGGRNQHGECNQIVENAVANGFAKRIRSDVGDTCVHAEVPAVV